MSSNNIQKTNGRGALPTNLPEGAKAFQAAVDGALTQDVWKSILEAQIEKAKAGDRGAAKFLLEYAGGVASMRGATFVQENHHHEHHYGDGTKPPAPVMPTGKPFVSAADRMKQRGEAERVTNCQNGYGGD